MNKTNPEKRNKTPGKAGCCAFIHAFLRLFRRKKRGRRAPCGGVSRAVLEEHAMEDTSLEESLPMVTHLEESVMHKTLVEYVIQEHEPGVEEHLMEEQEVEEHLMKEQVVEEHLKEEQETKADVLEEPKREEAVKKQPVRGKSRAAQPAVEEPDASDSDFNDDVADDSGSEESSWEECPRPARQGKASRGKAKNNSKMAAAPPSAAPELLLRPRGAVLTFLSAVVDPPAILIMGTDKQENDHLLTQATDRVVFFHVDDLPSAHVYLQLEPGQGMRDVPHVLLHDAAQLCKANSAQGNKLANVAVLYTPGSNLRKTRHMKVGEVGFVSDRDVRRIVIARRDDAVVDRLTRTKRKVVSGRAEREKQQRARERQRQKTEAKLARRKQRREEQQEQAAHEDPLELAWGVEIQQGPATRTTGRHSDEECKEEENQQQDQAETKTTRCFPVGAAQRRLLQGCRALVERRFDVRVAPPGKGEAEGRGTVTGAPEDVADALAELKKLLNHDTQKDAALDNKSGSGKRGKGGNNDKDSKSNKSGKSNKNDKGDKGGKNGKDGKNDKSNKNDKNGKDGRDTKAKGQNTKQKRKQ
ncbi:hypothetical protein O3P69_008499 [Scylla paramamosain]|uniref:Coiled-coil domain-containing protein 25 n=1 Tax=Scylla paramamosain TaxID=85552 RepID=A0AAW0SK92_SCYPA